jgi:hypothetical protein
MGQLMEKTIINGVNGGLMWIVHCQVWSPFKWCNRGYTNDKQLPSTGGEAQEKETWCDFLSTHYPEFLLFFVVFSSFSITYWGRVWRPSAHSLSLLTLYVNKVSLQYPTYQLSQSHTGNDLFKCRRKRSQSHWGTKGWTWSSYGQNTSWISRISTAKASANPLEALATHLCCSLGKLQSSSLEVKARQTLQKDTETDDGNKKWGKKLSLTSSCYACWLVAIPIIDYDDS